MGVVTQAAVVERLTSPDKAVQEATFRELKNSIYDMGRYLRSVPGQWRQEVIMPEIDVAAAETMYNEVRDYVVTRGYLAGKWFRPYLWTDVNEMGLDPEQPWWGFEFETGYSSHEAMTQALTYCWDTYDNVTFDSEGEGEYFSEVTFAPANMSDFLTNQAAAVGYINYLSDNKALTNNTGQSFIGTHINISVPSMRATDVNNRSVYARLSGIQRVLNRSVGSMTSDQLMQRFGRSPLYGGFFLNQDDNGNYWFEGKVFRTTYDAAVFENYVTVAEGITKAIQYLEANTDVFFIKNMDQLLGNPDAAIVAGNSDEFNPAACSLSDNGGQNYGYFGSDDDDSVWDEDGEEVWDEDEEEEGLDGSTDDQGRTWCAGCGVYHYA